MDAVGRVRGRLAGQAIRVEECCLPDQGPRLMGEAARNELLIG
jgi:hypothetical protein